jgi:hypothetical protein
MEDNGNIGREDEQSILNVDGVVVNFIFDCDVDNNSHHREMTQFDMIMDD